MIENPGGGGALRDRGAQRTSIPRLVNLENGHIVLSNGGRVFKVAYLATGFLVAAGVLVDN